jgi:hypothetical protein
MELKVIHGKSKKVALSPHQVAWQTRHGHANSYVVIRGSDLAIHVYRGADSTSLCMDGIDAVAAVSIFEEPYDWDKFWQSTAPSIIRQSTKEVTITF